MGASWKIICPLEWFPRLRDASEDQRDNWRLIADGIGIHWEEIDEDIETEAFLLFNKQKIKSLFGWARNCVMNIHGFSIILDTEITDD